MAAGFTPRFGRRQEAIALAFLLLTCVPVLCAQSKTEKGWNPPKTADGHPDLQGFWSSATVTPLERPADLGTKATFTPAEAQAFAKMMIERNNVDNQRSSDGLVDVGPGYNNAFYDRGTHVVKTLHTSLIVDPPDGKLPPMTADGQKRAADLVADVRAHATDAPEYRSLQERCILWPAAGPPMMPTGYNSNYQIVQSPGYVTIVTEMIHDVRIIPIDGRAHLPQDTRQWLGDSRGHWEGNTLVVETTNFTGKTHYRGTSDKLHLTERFSRMDAETLLYEFTVDDPATYTKPWTASVTMDKIAGPLYEYACHEGNYAMEDILRGAREQEKHSGGGSH